jgi:hypothetical protein
MYYKLFCSKIYCKVLALTLSPLRWKRFGSKRQAIFINKASKESDTLFRKTPIIQSIITPSNYHQTTIPFVPT